MFLFATYFPTSKNTQHSTVNFHVAGYKFIEDAEVRKCVFYISENFVRYILGESPVSDLKSL